MKILHYISMNIKNLTSFDMLKNLITEKIFEYKKTFESNYSATMSDNIMMEKNIEDSD